MEFSTSSLITLAGRTIDFARRYPVYQRFG